MHALNVIESTDVGPQREWHVARLSERGPDLGGAGQAAVLLDGSSVHRVQLLPFVAGDRGVQLSLWSRSTPRYLTRRLQGIDEVAGVADFSTVARLLQRRNYVGKGVGSSSGSPEISLRWMEDVQRIGDPLEPPQCHGFDELARC
ncbi:hypothetical protein MTO96_025858 [Rhipicephalus appendiculatus]